MASRTVSRREVLHSSSPGRAYQPTSMARATTTVAANDQSGGADVLGARVNALLEQLTAMRLELVRGVVPRAERGILVTRDLDYMRVQLDAAIAAARGIAATCEVAPVTIGRQRDFWRSEDASTTKQQER
jgi:hypothetical protein